MLVRDFGGEFKLIEKIAIPPKNSSVIKSIGDDCAVYQFGNKTQLVTKDMLAEDDHFSLSYFSPKDVGIKVAESNLSDIAAMGGKPLYAFIAISLPTNIEVEWVEGFYEGLYERLSRYNVDLLGGDTTHSDKIVISLTLIGEAPEGRAIYRGGAKAGDVLKITGNLGASFAGWQLFRNNIKGFPHCESKHRNPSCRLDISPLIAKHATAMIDISDGLASEVLHICKNSNTGAIVYAESVPIHEETYHAAHKLGKRALDFALNGGEDFELLFTVPKQFEKDLPGISIGEITEGSDFILFENNVKTKITKGGWDHFANLT